MKVFVEKSKLESELRIFQGIFEKKAIMEISNATNYSTIGIVTHGGPIRVVFREILKVREIDIADCAYAILNLEGQKLTLETRDGIEYKE